MEGKWFSCGETSPCSHPQGFCQGSGRESVCRLCKDYKRTCFTEDHIPNCTSVCNEQRTSSIAVTMATTTASSLSTGALVGLVIGSIAFVVLVILIIYGVTRYKRKRTRTPRRPADAEVRPDLQAALLGNANGPIPETANGPIPEIANGPIPETANGYNHELSEPRGDQSTNQTIQDLHTQPVSTFTKDGR